MLRSKKASKTFQRLMDKVLRGAEKYANSHQDDIIITSDTRSDHIIHIRDVLQRLRDANLVASASKTQFATAETKVLGVIVGSGVIRPDHEKVLLISRHRRLSDKSEFF